MSACLGRTEHCRPIGNGLSGDRIPIAGRIVAVADVFDAPTHARPDKEAWPRADALAELRRQSGTQFDPRVIDAFFELESRPQPGRGRAPARLNGFRRPPTAARAQLPRSLHTRS